MDHLYLHWLDYMVLIIFLLLSLSIGVFFYIYDKRRESPVNNEVYLMGNRSLNPVSVGLSTVGSIVNAALLIGGPAEIYRNGLIYSLAAISMGLLLVVVLFFLIPAFRKHKMTSCYEYLGQRFNSIVPRLAGSLVFIIATLSFLAIVLYVPSMVFAQVTGFNIDVLQLTLGLICTAYILLGGMKAIVWTDTIQVVFILVATFSVGVIGMYKMGGPAEVWRINKEGNRINFNVLTVDPRERHTVWSLCFLFAFQILPIYGANQMVVQRYMVVKSYKDTLIASAVALTVFTVMFLLVCMNGIVMYAYFYDCDPLKAGMVSRSDQMFLLLLMDVLQGYPGIPGLFIAAVFAAALSSVSSAINSLSLVVLEDFIKPMYKSVVKRNLSERSAVWIAKGLTLILGLVTISMSYIAPLLGSALVQIVPSISGIIMAPLLGVFVLALHTKIANAFGVTVGLCVSLAFSFWWAISSVLYGKRTAPLQPLGECFNDTTDLMVTQSMANYSVISDNITASTTVDNSGYLFQALYDVSYTYYGFVNTTISVIVGLIVSIGVNYINKYKKRTVVITGIDDDVTDKMTSL